MSQPHCMDVGVAAPSIIVQPIQRKNAFPKKRHNT